MKAIVQAAPGAPSPTELTEALLRVCREKLAAYKVPRSIEFRATLPRTETGKLQKRLLRDAYWTGAARRI